jgi:hypothetical protein
MGRRGLRVLPWIGWRYLAVPLTLWLLLSAAGVAGLTCN